MDDRGEPRSRRPHREATRSGSSEGSPRGSSRQLGAHRGSRNLAFAQQTSRGHDEERPGPLRQKGSGPFLVWCAPWDLNPEPAE